MQVTRENLDLDFDKIPFSEYWNAHDEKELRMHKIHAYPAKFPSFIVTKSIGYAQDKDIEVNSIGDIFCGCGTTALEAKQNDIDFWGCDINPVATLIAKVKSQVYKPEELIKRYELVIDYYENSQTEVPADLLGHERINYWFERNQIIELYNLLSSIKSLPRGKYRNFFLCAFSNILKPTSRWLTKSIKPQVDPNKPVRSVISCFEEQFKNMLKGVKEIDQQLSLNSNTHIQTQNFLKKRVNRTLTDLLVTSPPYVTSYEYADLHQLSTLWLGYTDDYRTLREGTIGSLHHCNLSKKAIQSVNATGTQIWRNLQLAEPSKAKSAMKYFVDIDRTVSKSYSIIHPGGMAVFVIGNTKYSGVKIDNAKYLTHCMLDTGFEEVEVVKRKVSSKILTPYRDKRGKFSADKRKRKVYGEEFIVIGQKPQE